MDIAERGRARGVLLIGARPVGVFVKLSPVLVRERALKLQRALIARQLAGCRPRSGNDFAHARARLLRRLGRLEVDLRLTGIREGVPQPARRDILPALLRERLHERPSRAFGETHRCRSQTAADTGRGPRVRLDRRSVRRLSSGL